MRTAGSNRVKMERLSVWPLLGMAGLGCVFFLYVGTWLVAPWWATLGMLAIWAGFLALGLRWWSTHPGRLMLLPPAAMLVWVVLINTGARQLGWSS